MKKCTSSIWLFAATLLTIITTSLSSFAQTGQGKTYPDGRTVYPDGTVVTKDGNVRYPDGTIRKNDGTVYNPNTKTTTYPGNRDRDYDRNREYDQNRRDDDDRRYDQNRRYEDRRYDGKRIPPGHAKKMHGKKSAKDYSHGHNKKDKKDKHCK